MSDRIYPFEKTVFIEGVQMETLMHTCWKSNSCGLYRLKDITPVNSVAVVSINGQSFSFFDVKEIYINSERLIIAFESDRTLHKKEKTNLLYKSCEFRVSDHLTDIKTEDTPLGVRLLIHCWDLPNSLKSDKRPPKFPIKLEYASKVLNGLKESAILLNNEAPPALFTWTGTFQDQDGNKCEVDKVANLKTRTKGIGLKAGYWYSLHNGYLYIYRIDYNGQVKAYYSDRMTSDYEINEAKDKDMAVMIPIADLVNDIMYIYYKKKG